MTNKEAVNWIINLTADIGKAEHRALWHYEQALCEIKELLESTPTEQPQWIPVSERLPEELEEVNITWTNTNPEPYYDFIKDKPATGSAVYYKGRWYWYSAVCTDYLREYGCSPYDEMDDAIKVLAWMPLPKAYKVTKKKLHAYT